VQNIISHIIFLFVLVNIVHCNLLYDPNSAQFNDGYISVYYNNPQANNFLEEGYAVEFLMTSYITDANYSVDIALYNFDSELILNALIDARLRGVVVRVVGDYNEINTPGYQKLFLNNFNVIAGNTKGIQHNKFMVIDSSMLITGTGNFTYSGFNLNNNNFIFIKDNKLADHYQREFTQMYSGYFSTMKTPALNTDFLIHKTFVESFFMPQQADEALASILHEIGLAQHTIYFMIFSFSQDEIATALIAAAARGVTVQGIIDTHFVTGTGQEAERLYNSSIINNYPRVTGPLIRADGNTKYYWKDGVKHGGKMHCKTLLVDPEYARGTIVTGSFNWSENALHNNDENLLIIHEQQAAGYLLNQWKSAWETGLDVGKKFTNNSGTNSFYQEILINEVLYSGTSDGVVDSDDQFVELYNYGSRDLDITGWTLTWKDHEITKSYSIPWRDLSVNLVHPGEYFTIYTKKGSIVDQAVLKNKIKIAATKDFVLDSNFNIFLYDKSMNLIDSGYSLYTNNRLVDYDKNKTTSLVRVTPSGQSVGSKNLYEPYEWRESSASCLQAICGSAASYTYASPGYQNVYTNMVRMQNGSYMNAAHLLLSFNGNISQCTDPLKYSMVSTDPAPLLFNILQSKIQTQFTFDLAPLSASNKIYKLSSINNNYLSGKKMVNIFGNFYYATETGLFVSGDGGVTFFKVLPIDENEFPVHDIFVSANVLYVASTGYLFVSYDGRTFSDKKIFIENMPLVINSIAEKTGNDLYLSTNKGVYLYTLNTMFLQIVFPGYSNQIIFTGTQFLFSSNNELYRIDLFNNFQGQLLYTFQNPVNYIVALNSNIELSAGNQLYRSLDNGMTFNLFYTDTRIPEIGIAAGNGIYYYFYNNKIYTYQGNNLVESNFLLSSDVKIESIYFDGVSYFLVSNFGIFKTGGSLVVPLFDFTCSQGVQPLGSLVMNGYSDKNDSAVVKVTEVASAQYPDDFDFLELFVETGGSLDNLGIGLITANGSERTYYFNNLYVSQGEFILIYFTGNDQYQKIDSSHDFYRKGSYTLYSSIRDLPDSDFVIVVAKNNKNMEELYFSNKDGNISGQVVKGLQRLYRNGGSLQKSIPYPVNNYNDFLVQDRGYDLSLVNKGKSYQKQSGMNEIMILDKISPGWN